MKSENKQKLNQNKVLKQEKNLLHQNFNECRDDIDNLESIVEDLAAEQEEFALAGDLDSQKQKIIEIEKYSIIF